jgi:S-disulfanyl-L-cysteine oxidoreductase SoxD
MPSPDSFKRLAILTLAVVTGLAAASQPSGLDKQSRPGYGTRVSEEELSKWNIDVVTRDGIGLPAGSGTIQQGKEVYDTKCAACHGEKAAGGAMFGTMVGGIGSFQTNTRVLTPGSMYPYAPVLFDYIRRAMPLLQPQSLSNEEVYAVSGYILHLNGLLPADGAVSADTLRSLKMPNRDGFIRDTRPDTKATRCMRGCKPL